MSRDVLIAIGGGLLSAVASVAFFGGSAFSFLFVYFAIVPLLMVGLALGPRAVTIAAGAGICATGIFGGIFPASIFGVVQVLPAWVITWLTVQKSSSPEVPAAGVDQPENNQWQSPGLALAVLSFAGGLFIVMAGLFAGEGGLRGLVDSYLTQAFQLMLPTMTSEVRDITISRLSAFFPGAIGASWVIMIVINAVVAQSILAKAQKSLRPTPAYTEMELPQWLSWPLIFSATIALFGSSIGAEGLSYTAYNVTMVIAIPYFFLGLAVIHSLARRVAQTRGILFGLYFILVIQIWAAVVVMGVGVVEQWFGLRDRQKGDKDGQLPVE